MNLRISGALLWACAFAGTAAAHEPLTEQPAGAQTLRGIVVTATRTPQPRSATLAPTTVITRRDIVRSQARSVAELLRRTPSVSVARQGGRGKLTSLFLRGTDSDHVLVLIDGVRYGDATSGLAKFQDLPVDQIERIEIVRGPRSSLYGSDAIGGVIQIFTRDGSASAGGATPYFSIGGGRYDTYEGQAGLSGSSERGHYHISIGGERSHGFDACSGRPFGAPGGGAGCFADQPDDDGYARVDGSLNAGYRFDDGLSVNAHYLRSEGDNEYDGTTANQSDTVQEVYGASAGAQLADFWHSKLSFGRSRDISDDHLIIDGGDTVRFASRFETNRDSVSWQNDFAANDDNLFTLGIDYRQDEVTSSVAYNRTKRSNKGLFGEYQGRFGRHRIDLAARGDDNQQFGRHATGSLTYGYALTDHYTASASYGTAFKAPTFNDLYYPSFPGFPPASNPNLDPEKSRSAELGLDADFDWASGSVHAYQTDIDDLIALNADFTPENIDQARIRGVEAEASADLGAWRFSGNANWLHAENRGGGANRGNELARRPDYTAQFDVDREFGRYRAGAGAYVAGSRYDDAANTRELGGYALFDLRASMQLGPAWQLQAKLTNLFDRDYATVAFYNQPGRSLFVTLRYQP